MEDKMNRAIIDITAMICLLVAMVSGLNLHTVVHHASNCQNGLIYVYGIHIISGILTTIAILFHCYQHKYWFVNYRKIPAQKKRHTTILLAIVILVVITGLILVSGHNTVKTSIVHYVTGIISFVMVIGHVIKRWSMFSKLLLTKR